MNEKQKRLSSAFIVISCTIILTITGILTFVAYQDQLAKQGDIFDKVVAEQHMIWVSPILVLLVGLAVAAAVLFFGLWKINKSAQTK
jgi:fructose-specific phosphotransferase system IIC component